ALMNHIDEGIIHAWLDGAVDAARSREIEAHVGQCQECSARVAEARGLIAGASRILTELDYVPAGVVPKRVAPPRRLWRAAPWVTGIAAALVLAIGIKGWNEHEQTKVRAVTAREHRAQIPAPIAAAPARPVAPRTIESYRDVSRAPIAPEQRNEPVSERKTRRMAAAPATQEMSA